MVRALADVVVRRPWLVVLAWVLLVGLALMAGGPWRGPLEHGDARDPLGQNEPYAQAQVLARHSYPSVAGGTDALFVFARPTGLTAADQAAIRGFVEELQAESARQAAARKPMVWYVQSHLLQPFLRGRLVAVDTATNRDLAWQVGVRLDRPFSSAEALTETQRIEQLARAAAARSAGLEVDLAGTARLGRDLASSQVAAYRGTVGVACLAVLVVLVLVYRAPLAAAVPMVTIAASLVVAVNGLDALRGYDLAITTSQLALMVVLLFAAGTDFAMTWVSRYHEELGSTPDAAAREAEARIESQRRSRRRSRSQQPLTATQQAARRAYLGTIPAILASAGTTILGLGILVISEFEPTRVLGPTLAVSLFTALLAALTLTPALALLVGPRLFWPRRPQAPVPSAADDDGRPASSSRVWNALAAWVVKRPRQVFWGSLAVLLVPLVLATRVDYRFDPTSDARATADLDADGTLAGKYFHAGELHPVTVLVQFNDPKHLKGLTEGGLAEPLSDDEVQDLRRKEDLQRRAIASQPGEGATVFLASHLYGIEPVMEHARRMATDLLGDRDSGVAEVWSLWSPEGTLQTRRALTQATLSEAERRYYWNPDKGVLRFDVVLASDRPFGREAVAAHQAAVGRLVSKFDVLLLSAKPYSVGATALSGNIRAVAARDVLKIQLGVALTVAAVLAIVLRNLLLTVVLVAATLATYFAAVGLAGTVYADLLGLGGLDWRVRVLAFVVLVAVGQDYTLIMVTRMLEERRRRPVLQAIANGLARTGAVITGCGLVSVVALASLGVSGLPGLQQLGLVLACGVAVDAFLIRPFLLPALMAMLRLPNRSTT